MFASSGSDTSNSSSNAAAPAVQVDLATVREAYSLCIKVLKQRLKPTIYAYTRKLFKAVQNEHKSSLDDPIADLRAFQVVLQDVPKWNTRQIEKFAKRVQPKQLTPQQLGQYLAHAFLNHARILNAANSELTSANEIAIDAPSAPVFLHTVMTRVAENLFELPGLMRWDANGRAEDLQTRKDRVMRIISDAIEEAIADLLPLDQLFGGSGSGAVDDSTDNTAPPPTPIPIAAPQPTESALQAPSVTTAEAEAHDHEDSKESDGHLVPPTPAPSVADTSDAATVDDIDSAEEDDNDDEDSGVESDHVKVLSQRADKSKLKDAFDKIRPPKSMKRLGKRSQAQSQTGKSSAKANSKGKKTHAAQSQSELQSQSQSKHGHGPPKRLQLRAPSSWKHKDTSQTNPTKSSDDDDDDSHSDGGSSDESSSEST